MNHGHQSVASTFFNSLLGGPVKIGAMMANSIADAARRSVPNCRARRGSQFESLSIMLRILFRFILQ